MRKVFDYFVTALLLCLCASNQAIAENWLRAESNNFIVFTNTNKRNAEAFVTKLEQYRFILSQFYLSQEQQALPAPKIEIYLTKERRDFNAVRPNIDEAIAGFVISKCAEGIIAFSHFSDGDNLNYKPTQALEQVENDSLIIFLHEYTHIFMAQNTTMIEPRWYTEGIAEYYSSMKFTDSELSLGHGSSMRLSQLLNGSSAIKYEDILGYTDRLRKGYFAFDFYAHSWLLTNFILHDRERKSKLPQYFTAINNGEDAVVAFERIFGIAVKDLPRILRRHLVTAKTKSFSIRDMPNFKIDISEMPPASKKLLFLDAAAKACPTIEYKPHLLAKIRAETSKLPNDEYAKNVLARAEIIIGEEEKALEHYKYVTAKSPLDAEAFYRLGQVYFLMVNNNKILPGETKVTQIAKARAAFARSYQLNPTNPANLYYYSMSAPRNANPPDESSVNAAVEAHLMSPSNRDYAFNAANILVLDGEYGEAKSVLLGMTSKSHQTQQSKELVAAIAAIDAKKSKEEILQALLAAALKIDEVE